MHFSTTPSVLGREATYTRSVAEAILDGLGGSDPMRQEFQCDDRGVWINREVLQGVLAWHPMCELDGLDGPNPLDEPWLPFPFTARELAAMMADGWGHFIQDRYGDWADGPDADELRRLGTLGGKAKEALVGAFQAYRTAVDMAPLRDLDLEARASALSRQYDQAREIAIAEEGLREKGISAIEYDERLARVNEAVKSLDALDADTRKAADVAHADWRRAVVQHLLLPIDRIPTEAFASPELQAISPDRRAEALHWIREMGYFQDSAAAKDQWQRLNQVQQLEASIDQWTSMNPIAIAEINIRDEKVAQLRSQLADLLSRLKGGPGHETGQIASGSAALEHVAARQERRLRDLRRLGGDWVKSGDAWRARDRNSGAFKKLVDQEKFNGSLNSSEKSVRKDLAAAAAREHEENRGKVMLKGLHVP